MIAQLTGTVLRNRINPLILDVHGVGYAVHMPGHVLSALAEGTTVTVYTYTYVREDALALFGFRSTDDLTLFELLLTVSGIGPKTALLVMDRGSNAVREAIGKADVQFFQSIPRLGKKNAQKIIIELKSKLNAPADLNLADEDSPDMKETTDALVSMGFDKKLVRETVRSLPAGAPAEENLKAALKRMAKRV